MHRTYQNKKEISVLDLWIFADQLIVRKLSERDKEISYGMPIFYDKNDSDGVQLHKTKWTRIPKFVGDVGEEIILYHDDDDDDDDHISIRR